MKRTFAIVSLLVALPSLVTAQELQHGPSVKVTAALQPLVHNRIVGDAVMLVATKDHIF
jgi:hypothetical protein